MQKEFTEIEFGNYFIPFSTHISKKSVISKSGLISQTIALQSSKDINMTTNIINAIQSILTEDVFINIHTIHTQNTNIKPQSFKHLLLKSYSHTVASHNKYTQEFHITISIKGHNIDVKNFGHFLLKKRFIMDVEESVNTLEQITAHFCEKLTQYQPHILGITSHDDIIYSENAAFLYNVFYGKHAQIPIADMEISAQIKPTSIKHEINYLKVTRGKTQEFIAVLTVKEFPIADKQKIAELFTIDAQYIIAQSLYQAKPADMQALFGYQYKITNTIRDNDISKQTHWNEMIATKQPICMQTNIIIQAESHKELEQTIAKLIKKMQYIGLVTIREDLNLEQTLYASLPANASFINRKDYTLLRNAGQFVSSPDFLFQGIDKIKNVEFLPIVDINNKLFALSPFLKSGTKHILMNGSHAKAKSIFINTMLLHLCKASCILCIDNNYSSFTLTKTLDGSCATHPSFNILNLLKYSAKSFFIFLTSAIKFYCIQSKLQYTQELASEIELFVKQIKDGMTFEQITNLTQDQTIIATLQYLQSQNFIAEKDVLLYHKNYFSINLDGDFAETHQLVCLYAMLHIIHTGKANDILKIDHTFDIFNEDVISQQTIAFILKEATAKDICFIMCNDIPPTFEEKAITKYADIFNMMDFCIFMESTCSAHFIKKFFQLKSNIGKNLMFVKQGTNKAVINNSNYVFTVYLEKIINVKLLEVFDVTSPKYIENIKLIDAHKHDKETLLNLFLNT